ncbi:hypothetical protein PINS_up021051 [Pythium insidiosum]|nr:hypothetical protein PINS_up021051 [Pythium insidiosum]
MTIGGQTAPLQGYLVGLRTSKGGENFCLGSLIAPDMVLTAAHCVKDLKFDQASVGSLFASTEEDGEQIKVRRVLIHPNFQADIFQNDFALVELEYISVQTPIALYSNRKNDYEAGTQLRFFGYDSTKKTSVRGLNSVDLRVVSPMDCMAALQPPVLDAAMLCAGGEEGKDACQGDSGGPLVLPTSSDVGLVAISSYGRGCGVKGMPAVYALASEAAAFIDKYTDGHKWKSLPLSITTPSSTSPRTVDDGNSSSHDTSADNDNSTANSKRNERASHHAQQQQLGRRSPREQHRVRRHGSGREIGRLLRHRGQQCVASCHDDHDRRGCIVCDRSRVLTDRSRHAGQRADPTNGFVRDVPLCVQRQHPAVHDGKHGRDLCADHTIRHAGAAAAAAAIPACLQQRAALAIVPIADLKHHSLSCSHVTDGRVQGVSLV